MAPMPHFDANGPFHEIVETYQFFVVGIELLHHANSGALANAGPVTMETTVQADLCIVSQEVKDRFDQKQFNVPSLNQALMRLLSNWAYERMRIAYSDDEWSSLRTEHPALEYLRHVRHASSHKEGRWHFLNCEPRHPAVWRGKQLSKEMHNKSMWETGLAPGDILILLSDVDGILVDNPPSGGW